jgi:histidine triad (HIT) family protein
MAEAVTGDCVSCRLIAAREHEGEHGGVVWFEPLNPVVPGHMLVVPRRHVSDALEDPDLTGRVMAEAARLAAFRRLHPCNIMTSAGREATQSVFHLHLHIVPRAAGDGLMLPWTEQQQAAAGQLAG